MSKRVATARWEGNLKEGKGTMSTSSGAIRETPFSFRTRFEEAPGTNPEELIGAAQAGCFSMALSAGLADGGMTPQSVETTATVTLEPVNGKPTVSGIHLEVVAKIPGADAAKFQAIAADTKENCPISRLLKPGTTITMNARLQA